MKIIFKSVLLLGGRLFCMIANILEAKKILSSVVSVTNGSSKSFSLINYLFLLFLSNALNAQAINRVEPPFWYVGMNNPTVQLLVYGENIGDFEPQIKNKNVTLEKYQSVENNNYLFIDLIIKENAKPCKFNILFKNGNKTTIKKEYELKPRNVNPVKQTSFSSKDVIYLITPDRFANGNTQNDEITGLKEGLNRKEDFGRHGGDIQGIIDHLDYIKEMGFTAIWLNPILENDQPKWSYHGYSTTDYYKVDPRFGTNEDYLTLIKKAKEKGLGVIMDIIVNHCGDEHWWMKDLPTSDWVNYQDEPYQETNHRKFSLLDPYAAPSDRKVMTEGWFVPTMPDLNQRNELMNTYLIQNSIWWIEYANLYGIRQDTYSYPFREFMTEWTCAIANEYPNFNIVGEEWVNDASIIAYWQEGKQNKDGYTSCLPSLMDFPTTLLLAEALKEEEVWGKGLIRLYENLGKDFIYANPENLVIFPDNHDMSRIFTQVNEDYDLYKMALTYILTMRGIPQIYYGTEILMHNRGTESHGVIRTDFPGGWQGDAQNTKTQKGLKTQQIEAQNWLKNLINWRNNKTVIHTGKLMHYEPQKGVYVYFRYNETETVMVVLNKNNEPTELNLDRFKLNLGNNKTAFDVFNQKEIELNESIILPAKAPAIFEILN